MNGLRSGWVRLTVAEAKGLYLDHSKTCDKTKDPPLRTGLADGTGNAMSPSGRDRIKRDEVDGFILGTGEFLDGILPKNG